MFTFMRNLEVELIPCKKRALSIIRQMSQTSSLKEGLDQELKLL